MIKLPKQEGAYEHENDFYLSCQPGRIGKLLAHYELYKRIIGLPGAIVECGIFKGASFARFAMFRSLMEHEQTRRLIGFDIFGKFPSTQNEADQERLSSFIAAAGDQSISDSQMMEVLSQKNCDGGVELIRGDILETVPSYLVAHPEFRISLLNLDVDILEPNVCILESFWPNLVKGGILVLDDYGIFPGATSAIDDYFADKPVLIEKLPLAYSPSFIVKK